MTPAELAAVYRSHPDESPLAWDDAKARALATREAAREPWGDIDAIDTLRAECGLRLIDRAVS